MTRRLECGEAQEEDESRKKEAPEAMGWGESEGQGQKRSEPPSLSLPGPEGSRCLQPPQPLVVEGGEVGRPKLSPRGSHLFPAAGSRSALWGGQRLTVRGIALTPRSLCEVLGLSPQSNL